MAKLAVRQPKERIGELDVAMQVTKAPEQKDSQQESQRPQTKLDNRYGKIGISAVAAACAHTQKDKDATEYRIPYDRD
jgi:hypothetical protein